MYFLIPKYLTLDFTFISYLKIKETLTLITLISNPYWNSSPLPKKGRRRSVHGDYRRRATASFYAETRVRESTGGRQSLDEATKTDLNRFHRDHLSRDLCLHSYKLEDFVSQRCFEATILRRLETAAFAVECERRRHWRFRSIDRSVLLDWSRDCGLLLDGCVYSVYGHFLGFGCVSRSGSVEKLCYLTFVSLNYNIFWVWNFCQICYFENCTVKRNYFWKMKISFECWIGESIKFYLC